MNTFDLAIITYINQFSQHIPVLDRIIVFLSNFNLFKGGVFAVMIWWTWFRNEPQQSKKREFIISTLVSCIIAIAIARVLALTLPFRLRPLHEESLHFLIPHGMPPYSLDGWSSFPSDHAALYFALATGFLFISRKAGAFALLYTTLIICFPRIYLGLHYPTDILAGAILGILTSLLSNRYLFKITFVRPILSWLYSKPEIFYPLFFLFTYQLTELFDSLRELLSKGYQLFQIIFS